MKRVKEMTDREVLDLKKGGIETSMLVRVRDKVCDAMGECDQLSQQKHQTIQLRRIEYEAAEEIIGIVTFDTKQSVLKVLNKLRDSTGSTIAAGIMVEAIKKVEAL